MQEYGMPKKPCTYTDTIRFYGYEHPLSNFYLSTFYDNNGLLYRSSEHYYQSRKSVDPAIQAAIRNARLPAMAKRMAKHMLIRSDWESIKVNVMMTALRYKFTQNDRLRRYLLDTKDKVLIENSPFDGFWGTGKDDTGRNQLGKCLMAVRQELSMDLTELADRHRFADVGNRT